MGNKISRAILVDETPCGSSIAATDDEHSKVIDDLLQTDQEIIQPIMTEFSKKKMATLLQGRMRKLKFEPIFIFFLLKRNLKVITTCTMKRKQQSSAGFEKGRRNFSVTK